VTRTPELDEIEPIPPDTSPRRTSFAQNGEDVRLWRALADVETGFYVEVGGWHPEEHSATRYFYGRGWSGIVLEPVPENAAYYRRRRPRDLVLQVLAGAAEGELPFHIFPGTGLSTLSPEIARQHEAAGHQCEVVRLPCRRLESILRESAPPAIHFMTVDVEGAEHEVLSGMDFIAHRPWIVAVEATMPSTKTPSFGSWEPILLGNDYEFVTFDGLNRFYVAREHEERMAALIEPPNVTDDFEAAYTLRLQNLVEDLSGRLSAAQIEHQAREDLLLARLTNVNHQLASVSAERDALKASLDGVISSASWRITAPLRRARRRP
jgi:FkbM family methyltransferase